MGDSAAGGIPTDEPLGNAARLMSIPDVTGAWKFGRWPKPDTYPPAIAAIEPIKPAPVRIRFPRATSFMDSVPITSGQAALAAWEIGSENSLGLQSRFDVRLFTLPWPQSSNCGASEGPA